MQWYEGLLFLVVCIGAYFLFNYIRRRLDRAPDPDDGLTPYEETTVEVPAETPRRRWRLTWPAWLRFNWKIITWAFVFACLIVGYILFHNYQDNRRYIKALNRKNELAKTEMRKMEVIAQIPPKRFEQVEEIKTIYKEPASKYKSGTIVQKTVSCGQVVSIETAGQTYDLDGVSGNAMCLQVSSNGITWNKVPHRFSRSPQTLFVKNTGTGDVTFKATFR